MIKTLLWDIDGTLLDFCKAEAYGIRKCFEIFNLGECMKISEILNDVRMTYGGLVENFGV